MNESSTSADLAAPAAIVGQPRLPSATYRLQLNRDFPFRAALAIVPYLHDLGISDLYVSPILKATPGSVHGYDICDHSQLNPELGREEDFAALAAALRERNMGLLLDTVPNHMSIACNNAWWTDVLENGPSSVRAHFFDIDWQPVKREIENKVLLPLLEDQYGKVLESGKLRLTYEDGGFAIYYYDHRLPVDPCVYANILGHLLQTLTGAVGAESEQVQELRSILTALSYLPGCTVRDPAKVAERNREKEVIKRRVAQLCANSGEVRAALAATITAFNGRVGEPESFDPLESLLSAQAYRPAFWRVAGEEINYRRFFDVNSLVAIRVEEPEVFQAVHQVAFRLLAEGKITGLRIDHPDGLWNPTAYFRQLQESFTCQRMAAGADGAERSGPVEGEAAAAEGARAFLDELAASHWRQGEPASWPLYVVAEKILAEGEALPLDWTVYGTTGYDFLNAVNGVFVDGANRKALDRIYNHFLDGRLDYRDLVNDAKKMIMQLSMASQINALGRQLERISEKNRWYRDFTLNNLTFAMREIIAALPVYRTYIACPPCTTAEQDRLYVETAVAEAKRRNPDAEESVFDFVRDTLLLRNLPDFRAADRQELTDFVMKFQQVTGPVAAKGVEDTVFYIYNRLVSLNEVGGEPSQFGLSVPAFHRHNAERRQHWPHSLLATSTHDTKRSEDVRARINVLSEIPREWRAALARWSRLNAAKKTNVDGELAPSRNDEYLLYQTLVGAWPVEGLRAEDYACFRERIAAYMLKATKEAKVHTSWISPNEGYDNAVRAFVERLLTPKRSGAFLKDLQAFQQRVAYYGQLNALSQVLLKLTAPGVPDIYQGSELWDFSLVDPDNRRPVDYRRRASLLADLQKRAAAEPDLVALTGELLDTSQDGRLKLYLTYRTLTFRRARQALFAEGDYRPLAASGPRQEHLCAFARTLGEEAVVVLAPRLFVSLAGGSGQLRPPLGAEAWQDTWLALPGAAAGQRYRHLYTGEELVVGSREGTPGLALAEVLKSFPVALLEKVEAGAAQS